LSLSGIHCRHPLAKPVDGATAMPVPGAGSALVRQAHLIGARWRKWWQQAHDFMTVLHPE